MRRYWVSVVLLALLAAVVAPPAAPAAKAKAKKCKAIHATGLTISGIHAKRLRCSGAREFAQLYAITPSKKEAQIELSVRCKRKASSGAVLVRCKGYGSRRGTFVRFKYRFHQ